MSRLCICHASMTFLLPTPRSIYASRATLCTSNLLNSILALRPSECATKIQTEITKEKSTISTASKISKVVTKALPCHPRVIVEKASTKDVESDAIEVTVDVLLPLLCWDLGRTVVMTCRGPVACHLEWIPSNCSN